MATTTNPPPPPPPTAPVKAKRPSFHAMSQSMVTVKVGAEALPFVLHKDLLCYHSGYFRGCFNGSFTEAQDGQSHHPDVEVTTFKTFVHWLYFNEVLFDNEKGAIEKKNTREAIQIYIFADRFDIHGLRRAIFDIISSYWKKQRFLPRLADIRYAVESLPEGSPLVRFFIDLIIYTKIADDDNFEEKWKPDGLCLSPEVLWQLFAGCKKRLCSGRIVTKDSAPYIEDICQYHEHASAEDKAACKSRKSAAPEKKPKPAK